MKRIIMLTILVVVLLSTTVQARGVSRSIRRPVVVPYRSRVVVPRCSSVVIRHYPRVSYRRPVYVPGRSYSRYSYSRYGRYGRYSQKTERIAVVGNIALGVLDIITQPR